MKLMIASDIHGSAYYCKQMLQRFKEEEADKLILLGDILYHGPRNDLPKEYEPKKVITMLNDIKDDLLCVRGNCDTEVDQMVLDFPILADYSILYVANRMIYLTHGHNYNKNSLPPIKKGDVLLHGHTHIPVCEEVGTTGIIYMNPGSTSIPKENSSHSYMIVDDREVVWKELDGVEYKNYRL